MNNKEIDKLVEKNGICVCRVCGTVDNGSTDMCRKCDSDDFFETRDLFNEDLGLRYLAGSSFLTTRDQAIEFLQKVMKPYSFWDLGRIVDNAERFGLCVADVMVDVDMLIKAFDKLWNKLKDAEEYITRFDEVDEDDRAYGDEILKLLEEVKL